MKKFFALIFFVSTFTVASAQSDSYQTIRNTFKGSEDVHYFALNGFLCRTVLGWADEHEFRNAITDIKNIRFITIPKSEFNRRNLSVNGFKQVLKEDSFEELAHFQDRGDYVTFFIQENRHNNRYFIIVDDVNEVVAFELKGDVDMNKLMKMRTELAYNDR